jgi:hypothetical protein
MKKVVSFSLWGNNDHYTYGAIENAKSIGSELYIGWESWFYTHPLVSDKIQEKIQTEGGKIIPTEDNPDYSMTFARFKPMTHDGVSIFVSRDCDSRVSDKEYQAVIEWEESDMQFHCIRDHRFHNDWAVMAGMWGCKRSGNAGLNELYERLIDFRKGDEYHNDQISLHSLYQKHSKNFLEHDGRARHNEKKFPNHKPFKHGSFIGERITHDNKPGPIEKWN